MVHPLELSRLYHLWGELMVYAFDSEALWCFCSIKLVRVDLPNMIFCRTILFNSLSKQYKFVFPKNSY